MSTGDYQVWDGTTKLQLPDDGSGISVDVRVRVVGDPSIAQVELGGADNSPLTATVTDGTAWFSGVELSEGLQTLTAQGQDSSGADIGLADVEGLDITKCDFACLVGFQEDGEYDVYEDAAGTIETAVMGSTLDSSVAYVRLSGGGMSSPLTEQVVSPGEFEFASVDMLSGSNTLTLDSLDTNLAVLDTRTLTFNVSGHVGIGGSSEQQFVVATKKWLRTCIRNSSPNTKMFCVSYGGQPQAICRPIPAGKTRWFDKDDPDPIGACIQVKVHVNGKLWKDNMHYIK